MRWHHVHGGEAIPGGRCATLMLESAAHPANTEIDPWSDMWAPPLLATSQRSLHNAPIFRLLLKVAVNGTHQCDSINFCGTSWFQQEARGAAISREQGGHAG